jgi:hypothetical protein
MFVTLYTPGYSINITTNKINPVLHEDGIRILTNTQTLIYNINYYFLTSNNDKNTYFDQKMAKKTTFESINKYPSFYAYY